jgi:GDPmannose 4,6-dehydratase
MKKAMITGITGQDGSYLAEFLIHKGYEVHGIIRRASTFNTGRIDHIYVDPHVKGARLFLHYGDLAHSDQVSNIVHNIQPDEIYNLAAQSHVRVSFDIPVYTADIAALGIARILQEIKQSKIKAKLYQASSSEMFGSSEDILNECSCFSPRSPYACAKLFAFWMVRNYREGYGLFASNGILFNHESPRRGETFVSRKITRAVAMILGGKQDILYLGNLDARRDWGFAPEYVEGMWRILQLDKADDFVIGTGESHTVRDFVKEAFSYAGLDWKKYVRIDRQYFRPTEVDNIVADSSFAKRKINWKPRIRFRDLVRIMVDADMRKAGLASIGEGARILRDKFDKIWWKTD